MTFFHTKTLSPQANLFLIISDRKDTENRCTRSQTGVVDRTANDFCQHHDFWKFPSIATDSVFWDELWI
jgi:hypothetical protein